MAVRTYTRTKDGATVYCALFHGPDGRQLVRKVRTLPADASRRQHDKARAAAEHYANVQRAAVENGDWRDPKDGNRRLRFSKLVDRFLKEYRTRTGRIDYYSQRAAMWRSSA